MFSLKNASFPEYQFETKAGVMSLDFHPKYSDLIALGLYDGEFSPLSPTLLYSEPILLPPSIFPHLWSAIFFLAFRSEVTLKVEFARDVRDKADRDKIF